MPAMAATSRDGAGDREHEVQRVDRLGDEDPAAVAGVGAAARLVVVGLRPPPGQGDLHRREGAERARADEVGERARAGAHPVLEDDAEGDPRPLADLHQLRRGGGAALERLLGEDVLPGPRRRLDEAEPGVGRGEDEDRLHARIVEQRLQRAGLGQAVAGGEGGAPGGVAGEDAADLDLARELGERAGVHVGDHAEAHDPDPQRLHRSPPCEAA